MKFVELLRLPLRTEWNRPLNGETAMVLK